MKKRLIITITIALTVLFVFTGCGKKPKTTSPTSSITTEDGSIKTGDNLKWPDSNMGKLAKPNCKITAVLKDDKTGNYTVAFSDMKKEDAVAYVAKLKELGYSGGMEVNDADGVMFSGTDKNGVMVTFTYNYTAKEGTVSYLPKGPDGTSSTSSSSSTSSTAPTGKVDMTDAAAWPANFISGVPELKGKIVDIVKNNNTIEVALEYVEKADYQAYVKQLKQNGYTVDVDETTGLSNMDFRAYNEGGEWVQVYFSIYEGKNNATVIMEKAN